MCAVGDAVLLQHTRTRAEGLAASPVKSGGPTRHKPGHASWLRCEEEPVCTKIYE